MIVDARPRPHGRRRTCLAVLTALLSAVALFPVASAQAVEPPPTTQSAALPAEPLWFNDWGAVSTARLDGTEQQTRLSSCMYATAGDLDPSPDGSRVLYTHGAFPPVGSGNCSNSNVWVANADGGNKLNLSHVLGQTFSGQGYTPRWSPRGDLVAWRHGEGITISAPDGSRSQVAVVTPPSEPLASFAWSPDGTEIAYSYHHNGCGTTHTGVYTLDTRATRIVHRPCRAYDSYGIVMDWGVTGMLMLASGGHHRLHGLNLMQPDGQAVTHLYDWDARQVSARLSPDSRWIVTSNRTPDNQFWITYAPADGSGPWTRVPLPATSRPSNPTWGPIKADQRPPLVTARPSRAPDSAGWYSAPVMVEWSVEDEDSPPGSVQPPPAVVADVAGADVGYTSAKVCDPAGNCATGTVRISLDTGAPTVTPTLDVQPNEAGWHRTPVVVSYACADDLSGVGSCPDAVTISEGGIHRPTAYAVDNAGNSASAVVEVRLDVVAPVIGVPNLGRSPLSVGTSTTVTVPVSDDLSGVRSGTAMVISDAGERVATVALARDGETLTGILPAFAATGVYSLSVTGADTAGNSAVTSSVLVAVFDPDAGSVTGAGWVIPGGATSDPGDHLPAIDGRGRANFTFHVGYEDGTATVPSGDFRFTYRTGGVSLHSSAYDWLVISGDSWAHIQGPVVVDGEAGLFLMRVSVREAAPGEQSGRIVMNVWAPGADPDRDAPVHRVSGDVTGQIRIHR